MMKNTKNQQRGHTMVWLVIEPIKSTKNFIFMSLFMEGFKLSQDYRVATSSQFPFTTESLGFSGTHLIDLGWVKG